MNAPVIIAQATPTTGIGARPVVKLTKPQSNQAVTLRLDGTAQLDLSEIGAENITLVRVGERLVVLFDNQATVTVEPFFGRDGQPLQNISLQLDSERVVDATQFANLFPISDDQSILPAAGEGGARNTGGQFGSFQIDAFTGRNGLDLLGGETLGAAGFGAGPGGNGLPTALDIALGLDEDEIELGEGNLDGPGDDFAPSVVTGTLPVSFGPDGVGGLFFNVANGPVAGLTSGGDPVSYVVSADGRTITATTVNGTVFTIEFTINADSSVTYTVTLFQPLDHAGHDDLATAEIIERAFEDNILLGFPFTVQDANGDSASATLTLNLDDDTPVVTLEGATHGTVDEDGCEGVGNPGDSYADSETADDAAGEDISLTGALGLSWGADRFNDVPDGGISGAPANGDRAVVFSDLGNTVLTAQEAAALISVAGASGPIDLASLTSGGEAITYTLSGNGSVLTATTVSGPVFTVALSDTSGTGSYTFTLQGPLDHPQADTEDDLDLTFNFTAYDSDGDAADGSFTVTVDDDGPVIGGPDDNTVDEDGLEIGNAGDSYQDQQDAFGEDVIVAGSLAISWGADDRNASENGGISGSPANGDRAVVFATLPDGVLTLEQAATILTVSASDTIDLGALTSNGESLVFALSGNGTVLTATTSSGAPVFTVTYSDTDAGSYRFELQGPLDHPEAGSEDDLDLEFNYIAFDADGDAADGSFFITIDDDAARLGEVNRASTVDEEGLPGGNHDDSYQDGGDAPGTAITSGAVSLGIQWGADSGNSDADGGFSGNQVNGDRSVVFSSVEPGAQIGDLTSGNLPVRIWVSQDGTEIIGYRSQSSEPLSAAPDAGTQVFRVTLSDADEGSYRFDLIRPFDHGGTNTEDDIDLAFAFTARDADGDAISGSFTVTVDDDAPESTGVVHSKSVYENELPAGTAFGLPPSDLNGDGSSIDTNYTGNLKNLVSFGADKPGTYVVETTDLAPELLALSSGGVPLSYSIGVDNMLIARANGVEIFNFQVDPNTGQYSFRLKGPLDHIGSDAITLDMSSAVTARDFDGDTLALAGQIFITVRDDTPIAGTPATETVSEDGTTALTDIALGVKWGSDNDNTPDANGIERTLTFSGNTVMLGGSSPISTLTSNGIALIYVLSADGTVLTAYRFDGSDYIDQFGAAGTADDAKVFVVSLDDADGTYDFALLQPVDHPAPNGANQHYVDLTFDYTATDADGDPDDGGFTVRVDAAGTVSSISYANLDSGVFVNLSDGAVTRLGETVGANTATDREMVWDKVVGIDQVGDTAVAYGSQDDDILVGGDEANQLYGNAGNDLLVAGKGNDTLDGGAGADTLVVSADIDDAAAYGPRNFDLGNGTFRSLSLGGLSGEGDTLHGGAQSDIVQLEKAAGAAGFVFDRTSSAFAMSGVEQFVGTEGNDIIMLPAAYTADHQVSIFGQAGNDSLSGTNSADFIYGGTENDLISGLDGDDSLYGEDGNDEIHGGAGKDLIEGGAGNDILSGGVGDDTVKGGGGDDRFLWRTDHGADYVNAGDGFDTMDITQDVAFGGIRMQLTGGFFQQHHVLLLDGASNVTTDLIANGIDVFDITFQNGHSDELESFMLSDTVARIVADMGGGNDTWRAGTTTIEDEIDGGDGRDRAIYTTTSNATGGVQINLGSDAYADAPGGPLAGETVRFTLGGSDVTDRLYNFEDAEGGQNADLLIGSAGANQLIGHEGNDTLIGRVGNDVLQGGAGDDTIVWGIGDGSDTLDGGTETSADIAIINGDAGNQIVTITAADNDLDASNGVQDPVTIAIDQDGDSTDDAALSLTEIEDIVFSLGAGADQLVVNTASFTGTSLAVSTIRADMGADDDTLDLHLLGDNHRVVSDGGSGDDTVKLAFAYPGADNIQAFRDESGNLVGVGITWPGAAGGPVTHEFSNYETFEFADGTRTLEELFNVPPETQDVTADGDEDTLIAVALSGSDVDGNLAGFRITGLPASGTLYSDATGTLAITAGQVVGGTVYFKPDADWSGTTNFQYVARDTLGLEAATPGTATITVAPADDPAAIGTPSVSSVTEDVAVNGEGKLTASGTISISDPDGQDQNAFLTSVTGAEGNLGTLVLQATGAYTYTVANSAVQHLGVGESTVDIFTVTSVDGTTSQVAFTIHGTNDPARDAYLDGDTVDENAPIGTVVGHLRAFDADGDPVSWYINGTASGRFTIDSLTGEVRTAVVLDYETLAGQIIAATPLDPHGAGDMLREFTIHIRDVNEAPTGAYAIIQYPYVSSTTTAVISENTHVTAPVRLAWIGVLDDALGEETYSLSGADAASFELQGSWLFLRAGIELDYESKSAYQVTVDVDDPTVGNTPDASVDLTLAVGNIVNEPVAGSDSYAVGENGTLSGTAPGLLANDSMPGGFPLTVNLSTLSALALLQAPSGTTIADLGALSVSANGSFSYAPSGDFNQLRAGEQAILSFSYRAANGVANSNLATVTIAVTGQNDAPDAVNDAANSALAPLLEGNATATGEVTGALLANDSDPDQGETAALHVIKVGQTIVDQAEGVETAVAGTYGTLYVQADGSYRYVLDNTDPDTNGLREGQSVTEIFTYTAANNGGGAGNEDSATLTVHIRGTNDIAVISAPPGGGWTEGFEPGWGAGWSMLGHVQGVAGPQTEGTQAVFLTGDMTDDTGNEPSDAAIEAALGLPGGTLDAAFARDAYSGAATATQLTLAAGTYTLSFDWMFMAGDLVFPGFVDFAFFSLNGTVTMLTDITAVGDFGVADWSTFTVTFTTAGTTTLGFGVMNTGDDQFDSALWIDNVQISGATPTDSAMVAEDGVTTASGRLLVTDPDQGESFAAVVASATSSQGYGTYTILADGTWTYTLNNSHAAVQSLRTGQTLTDTFVFRSQDGTAERTVTITIEGRDDAPVITGTTTGTVTEDVPATASGQITVVDPDSGQSGVQPVTTPLPASYGAWTVTAAGLWSYTLDHTLPAVQRLAAGEQITDSFTILTLDGTPQVITVTITGSNDGPTVRPVVGNAVEDGGTVFITLGGDDIDSDDLEGTLTYQIVAGPAAGLADVNGPVLVFKPDVDFQHLAQGETAQVTVTYRAIDRHGAVSEPSTVTITVTGTNDAPQISFATGNDRGAVTEDVSGIVSGQLSATDVDNGANLTWSVLNGTGSFGTLSVDQTGKWTYVLDQAAANGLSVSDHPVETFTVLVRDQQGAMDQQTVTVTVNGSNDAPVALGESYRVNQNGTLTIDGPGLLANDSDPDDATLGVLLVDDVSHGTLQLSPDGSFIYTPAAGYAGPDSFSYRVGDGDAVSDVVTVAIHVNDPPRLDLDANDDAGTGTGYVTTYAERGAGVAIVDEDVSIADSDDSQIERVTVTLANGQFGDHLVINGALPAGITAAFEGASLILSGGASMAAYESALKQITFSNSQGNTGLEDRTVTIVASDGEADSNIATTTIHVTPYDDPPVLTHLLENDNVRENQGFQVVATFTVNDVDTAAGLTFTVLNNQFPWYEVRAASGTVFGQPGNYEIVTQGHFVHAQENADGDPTITKTLQISDGSSTIEVPFTFTVTQATALPQTATDMVTTNAGAGQLIAIPDEVLLRNDTDADSTLSIRNASGDVFGGDVIYTLPGTFPSAPAFFDYRAFDGSWNVPTAVIVNGATGPVINGTINKDILVADVPSESVGNLTTSPYGNPFVFGEGTLVSEYVGQTFVASGGMAHNVQFGLDHVSGGDVMFRVMITAVDSGADPDPTQILFTSDLLTLKAGAGPTAFDVLLNGLQLAAGQTYALILDAYAPDGTQGVASVLSNENGYANGVFLSLNPDGGTEAEHFNADWLSTNGWDMAFRITSTATAPTGSTLNGGIWDDSLIGDIGNDILNGERDDDWLYGRDGNDTLDGGAGNDRLIGGRGEDQLHGGAGADSFELDTSGQGLDHILDFTRADGDVIALAAESFGLDAGDSAASIFRSSPDATFDYAPGERLHFDTSTHTLWYDGDGAAGAAAVALARLENGVDLQASDLRLV